MQNIFLFLPLLFLFFAQTQVLLFGVPFYPLELLTLPLLFILWQKRATLGWLRRDLWLSLGLAGFVLGAVASFLVHPWSLGTLGVLKSWFFFPIVFFLAGLAMGEFSIQRMLSLLKSWLIGLIPMAFLAAGALVTGNLTYDGRLSWPDTSPNFLAELLVPGLFLSIFFWQRAKGFCVKTSWTIGLLGGALLVIGTRSYGAFLAGGIALLVYALLVTRGTLFRRSLLSLLCVALLGLLLFFFEGSSLKFREVLSLGERSSLASRAMIWQAASRMIADNPLFPVALGNFQETYLAYQALFPPYLEWAVPQPHNLLLALWLQVGLVGLLSFGIFVGKLLWLLWKVSLQTETERQLRALLMALWTFLLCFGLLDTPYFRNDLAFVFWTQVLLTLLFIKKSEPGSDSSKHPYTI